MNVTYANESERQASELLLDAFGRTFEDVRVLVNLIVPLPAGSRIATAEFDCVVICNAGVYLFEVKGWHDCYVYREKLDGLSKWFTLTAQGRVNAVVDPVAQNAEKLIGLRSMLDRRIALRSHVLLPGCGVDLDPKLPGSVVMPHDLPYLTRLARSNTRASKVYRHLDHDAVALIESYLLSMSEGLTLEQHIANCREFHDQRTAHRLDASADSVLTHPAELLPEQFDCASYRDRGTAGQVMRERG